ncbi:MAG TPA: bifunctional DedA family/phosphatase PAP2 family protein, partial [Solirubrobacterales bacterium]|nr:bifunctional DedA family/phosphatase PAP2 family protein [Solirubrobacterales bacterium]
RIHLPEDRRQRRAAMLGIAIGVAIGYVLISRVVPHDELQHVLEDVANALGGWTYLFAGIFAFAETGAFVGLVLPGETLLLVAGAVAGQGVIDVYILIAIAWFAAWAGDTTSFVIGRRLGRGFILRHGPRVGVTHERFEQVEDYFAKHGGKTVFFGRFIGFVRALAPFVAGSSGMPYRTFLPSSILGAGILNSIMILLGYAFSRSIDTAAQYAGRGAFLLGTLLFVVVGSIYLYRRLRVEENRREAVRWMEGHAATRWLVVLVRRFQPQLRFLWNRVTPGGTFGLEFTSLMAILAVAGFVVVGYTAIVSGDSGPTPGDVTAFDVAGELRAGWLVDAAKAVTTLGSLALVLPLAALCGLLLAWRRRWAELGVLVAGLGLTYAGVHELKDAVDRPRPEGGLVDVSGSSFPSAHAAYSTFYVWLAVTIVMRLRAGMARGALVVSVGIAMAALVGLSRVYLDVHYLSDVNAGWALGAAAFSLCAAVALVVTTVRSSDGRVRQNEPDAAPA